MHVAVVWGGVDIQIEASAPHQVADVKLFHGYFFNFRQGLFIAIERHLGGCDRWIAIEAVAFGERNVDRVDVDREYLASAFGQNDAEGVLCAPHLTHTHLGQFVGEPVSKVVDSHCVTKE